MVLTRSNSRTFRMKKNRQKVTMKVKRRRSKIIIVENH